MSISGSRSTSTCSGVWAHPLPHHSHQEKSSPVSQLECLAAQAVRTVDTTSHPTPATNLVPVELYSLPATPFIETAVEDNQNRRPMMPLDHRWTLTPETESDFGWEEHAQMSTAPM